MKITQKDGVNLLNILSENKELLLRLLFIFFILAITLFLLFNNFIRTSFFIAVIFLSAACLITNSNQLIYFLVMFVLFFLPQSNRYNILPIIHNALGIALLALVFFSIFYKFDFNSSYNTLWLLLSILIIAQSIIGIIKGHQTKFLINEIFKILFYPIGFYFTIKLLNKKNIETLMKKTLMFFLIMGIIITIQMLIYYFTKTFGMRVLTRQANLLLLSLSTSLTLLLFYRKLNFTKKIYLVLCSLIYLIGILLFMQRSLWIATGITILSLVTIYLIQSKQKMKIILIVIILLLISSFIFQELIDIIILDKTILNERTETVKEEGIQSFSIAVRLISYVEILKKVKNNILFGLGIGDDIVTSYLNQRVINIVDNSIIVILWKLGLIGILLFALIYIKCFSQMIYLLKNNKNNISKIFVIVVFINLIGQIVNSMACVILIYYAFNFIWASQIAFIDKLYIINKSTKVSG